MQYPLHENANNSSRRYPVPYSIHGRFFLLHPLPLLPGNSCFASYLSSKSLACKTPLLTEFPMTFWGGEGGEYGYFLETHNQWRWLHSRGGTCSCTIVLLVFYINWWEYKLPQTYRTHLCLQDEGILVSLNFEIHGFQILYFNSPGAIPPEGFSTS